MHHPPPWEVQVHFHAPGPGCSICSDYFNTCTDEGIKGMKGFYKNIDDVLVAAPAVETLEKRMQKMLDVCMARNMKLIPKKLQLGRKVTFGGILTKSTKKKTGVYLSPVEEKLRLFRDTKTPNNKTECKRDPGLAPQLKKFEPGLMLEFPNIWRMSAHNVTFTWSPEL